MTTKAVRYYESRGLVTPVRLSNGYRDWDERDVRLVREIRSLSGLGIPVERTKPFLDCLTAGHGHADDCPASMAGYRDTIDELTQRIDGLTARRSVLVAHLHEAADRGNRVSPPPDERGELMTDLTSLPSDLPVPVDDGAAAHLPGASAPHLELRATDDSAVRLDSLVPGRTVLYIYPLSGQPGVDLPDGWDNIPGARGCTPEACGFRDHHQDLIEAGAARVYGLSTQDTDYQRELVDRLHLPFLMLSDPTVELAKALDLPTFEASGRTLYKRLTLLIRDGLVEHAFYPIFPPSEHAEQVLSWLRDSA